MFILFNKKHVDNDKYCYLIIENSLIFSLIINLVKEANKFMHLHYVL